MTTDVRVQIISDLHLESPSAYDVYEIPSQAPYLALLGDIGYTKNPDLIKFLRRLLAKFEVVFYLLGNHEPYGSSWPQSKKAINELQTEVNASEEGGKLVFLDRTRHDLSEDVTILGCTLFSHILNEQLHDVKFGLNDFFRIDDWIVEEHNRAHKGDVSWLNSEVASIQSEEPHRKILIMTHHSPTTDTRAVDPLYAQSPISSGFCTNLSGELCRSSEQVKIWVFGHTHFNCDYSEGETRFITNQRGYYFAQAAGFNPEYVLEL